MKIQTTEAVRRFNAQVELADIALTAPFFNLTDTMSPERLHLQLLAYGHAELAAELRKSAEAIGYSWTGAGARHSAESAPIPSIHHTKSKDACRHGTCVENDAPDKEHYAWKCADCGYVYGKESSHASVIDRLEDSVRRRDGSNYHGITQLDELIDQALGELRRITNWREFAKNSARPGDVANVMLKRDELRIACTAALEEMRAFRSYWTSPKMNMARTKCTAEELCERALES